MDQIKLYSNTIKEIRNDIFNNNIHTNYSGLFQNNIPYEKRCADYQRICAKYPSYIPIIVNCLDKGVKLKKNKYLVPKELECYKLVFSIRSQLVLDPSQAIFLFVDDVLFDNASIIGDIYEQYKIKNKIKNSDDLYMYITLTTENTFG